MGFTEGTFLFVFLPISICIYLIIERFKNIKLSNAVLVAMSFVFYGWSSLDTLALFILFNILVYILGHIVYLYSGKESKQEPANKWIKISLFIIISILIYYKYLPFIFEIINGITAAQLTMKDLIVPIGVSFITFEAVSYVTDIYKGEAKPGTLLETFTFLSMFPKLVSGPIVLWRDFKLQIASRESNLKKTSHGIDRIIIGFAKKAIIADTFGASIVLIENGIVTSGVDTQTMWLRSILYFFQLYYDFSGYSDIAIGLCIIFGFSVKDNFNYPYISTSVSEFWRRWHISLGNWFREYVYIPLGGNRQGNVYLNLFTVFLLTGIWHGANWTFVLWGIVNGFFVVVERLVKNKTWYKKIPSIIKWCVTSAVIFFAWVLFMSADLSDAGKTFTALFTARGTEVLNFTWQYYLSKKILILLIIAAIGAFIGATPLPKLIRKMSNNNIGSVVKKIILIFLFIVSILFVVNSTYSPFMYFQF